MSNSDFVLALRRQYAIELDLYDRYHRNTLNSLIHVMCITCEWTGTLLLLHQFHLAWAATVIVSAAMIPVSYGGLMCSMLLAAMQLFVQSICDNSDVAVDGLTLTPMVALGIGVSIHAISWTVQVGIGHYMIECNSPSMVESLSAYGVAFSLLMAWDNGYRKLSGYGLC